MLCIQNPFKALLQILYIPCFYVFYKMPNRSSCYQIMLVHSVIDIIGIQVSGFLAGIACFQGWVYCQNPNLIFVISVVSTSGFSDKCGRYQIINYLDSVKRSSIKRLVKPNHDSVTRK